MNTSITNADRVLQLLRHLPPRERLRVVAQILPELAEALPTVSTVPNFWAAPDLDALITQQGVTPVTDFDTLLGGWPEDESVEPFLTALQTWREQNLAMVDIK